MAIGMRHWIGAVAFGCAAVAVWNLPPAHLEVAERRVRAPAEVRRGELEDEFRWTSEALRRRLWIDSLSTLAVGSARDGVAFGVPTYAPAVEPGSVDELERRVRAEVDALPRRAPGIVFGYFLQKAEQGQRGDMTRSNFPRTETFLGSADGSDYCLQVRVRAGQDGADVQRELDRSPNRARPVTSSLGVCRWYLQYGLPGDRVQEWLRDGGARYALEVGDPPTISEDVQLEVALHFAFGFNQLGFRDMPIEVTQCQAGIPEACGSVFAAPRAGGTISRLEAEVVRRTDEVVSIGGGSAQVLPADESYVLWDLERDFGPEAFQAFWSSDAPVEEAFEVGFGVEPGVWMAGWIGNVEHQLTRATPALPRSASSGGVLAVALLVGVAFLRNRKRSVV